MHLHESVTNTRTINTFNRYKLKLSVNEQYDYSKVVYKYSTEQVIIICKLHGEFKQALSEHLKGRGCPTCGKEKMRKSKSTPFKLFESKSNNVHKNKYIYDKTAYTKLSHTTKITCPVHGEFVQKAEIHMNGSECPKCAKNKSDNKLRLTQKQFIEKAKLVHGNKYDYYKVKYEQYKIPVTITCHTHGDFEQTPASHLKGSGCIQCVNEYLSDTTETFINKAFTVHGTIYTYNKVSYSRSWVKVTITCPIHGDWNQLPSNHLAGKGCPLCKGGGFDQTKPGLLYYVKVKHNNKIYYKIGITNKTVEERFGTDMQYIQILHQIHYIIGKEAFDEEQRVLKKYKQYQYTGPDILKSGNTELFNIDIQSVGYDQAHMVTLPNNADLPTIIAKLATLQE